MINWWLIVMSRIMVMSNIMNFPRFWHFARRNVWDTVPIFMLNVIPVISVRPILYQLPFGAKPKWESFFSVFSINYTIPEWQDRNDINSFQKQQPRPSHPRSHGQVQCSLWRWPPKDLFLLHMAIGKELVGQKWRESHFTSI